MENKVIEVLDKEHGKKVIEYWKSKGIDTRDLAGSMNKKDGCTHRFYGVINGNFDYISMDGVYRYDAEIIELPKEEKTFPRVMMVSRDNINFQQRVVIAGCSNLFLYSDYSKTLDELHDNLMTNRRLSVSYTKYAKELPIKRKLTKAEIAEKFGIDPEQIEIV